jgi:hypothetical protein
MALQDDKEEWIRAGCGVISSRIRSTPAELAVDHLRRTKFLYAVRCKEEVIPPGIPSGGDYGQYQKGSYLSGMFVGLVPREIYYQRGIRVRLLTITSNFRADLFDLEDDDACAQFYQNNMHDFALADLIRATNSHYEPAVKAANDAKIYFEEIFRVPDLAEFLVKTTNVRNFLLKLGKEQVIETRQVLAREYPHLGMF